MINFKFFLLVFVMMIAKPVWAGWEQVSQSSGDVFFIEPTTIKKDGIFRKVWGLIDLAKPIMGHSSRKYLQEYDCKNETTRILTITAFSKQMGNGDAVGTESVTSKWEYIIPDSVDAALLKRVCRN